MAGYKVGDIGTGKTDTCVGISDAAYGVFMVAPKHLIELCAARQDEPNSLSPEQIRDYVFDFWNPKSEPRKQKKKKKRLYGWKLNTW
jgi:hypothetical protein